MSFKKEIFSSEIAEDFIKYSKILKNAFKLIHGESVESIYIFRKSRIPNTSYEKQIPPKSLDYIFAYSERQYLQTIPRYMKSELTDNELERLRNLSGGRMIMLKKLEDLSEKSVKIAYATFRLASRDGKHLNVCSSVVFNEHSPETVSIYTESEEVMKEIDYQLSFKRKFDDAKTKVKTATQPLIKRWSALQLRMKEVVKQH
jgi:hypothetical protein